MHGEPDDVRAAEGQGEDAGRPPPTHHSAQAGLQEVVLLQQTMQKEPLR